MLLTELQLLRLESQSNVEIYLSNIIFFKSAKRLNRKVDGNTKAQAMLGPEKLGSVVFQEIVEVAKIFLVKDGGWNGLIIFQRQQISSLLQLRPKPNFAHSRTGQAVSSDSDQTFLQATRQHNLPRLCIQSAD